MIVKLRNSRAKQTLLLHKNLKMTQIRTKEIGFQSHPLIKWPIIK
jgi:site-specific recombinase XerC